MIPFKTKIKVLIGLMALVMVGFLGFSLAKSDSNLNLKDEMSWKKLSKDDATLLLSSAIKYGPWENISKEVARNTLPKHLDASDVGHGDLSVSSEKVHSGRYIISQWQRVASGAIVVVFGIDDKGSLSIALGSQRGALVTPQGYMESYLPKDDLTGLREKGASRINGTTNEIVVADSDIEECAVREVKEELGLDISQKDLQLVGIESDKNGNKIVHTIAPYYTVLLKGTPDLKTLDTEFIEDDMQQPFWVNVTDIYTKKGLFYTPKSLLPIDKKNIFTIQNALKKIMPQLDNKLLYEIKKSDLLG